MRRVCSRQRIVSWDAFDATAQSASSSEDDTSVYEEDNDHGIISLPSNISSPQCNYIHANQRDKDSETFECDPTVMDEAASSWGNYSGSWTTGILPSIISEEEKYGSSNIVSGKKRERRGLVKTSSQTSLVSLVDCLDRVPFFAASSALSEQYHPPLSREDKADMETPAPLEFMDLNQDVHLHALSFLSVQDVMAVSLSCKQFRDLLQGILTNSDQSDKDVARNAIWIHLMIKLWPWIQNFSRREITFINSETLPTRTMNFGPLLNQAVASLPTHIELRTRKQDTIDTLPFRCDDRMFSSYRMTIPTSMLQAKRSNQNVSMDVPVVQYIGPVGQDSRCIRSNQPFPRPILRKHITPDTLSSTLRKNQVDRVVPFLTKRSAMKTERDRSQSTVPMSSFFSFWGPRQLGLQEVTMRRRRSVNFARTYYNPESNQQTRTPFVYPHISHLEENHQEGQKYKERVVIDLTPRMVVYFEVTILPRDPTQEPTMVVDSPTSIRVNNRHSLLLPAGNQRSVPSCVAVGLSDQRFGISKIMPGWDNFSYGYHGDDGGIFHGKGHMLRVFGPLYGPGDTIGCGVNYDNGGIFFTLNGSFLGYAWLNDQNVLDAETMLYPTVGVDTDCPIYCNFGSDRPYLFDFSDFIACSKGYVPFS